MNLFFAIAGIAAVFTPYATAQTRRATFSCRPVAIASQIEAAAGELTLADLFPPSTCPELSSAARRVHLGNVPLPGSERTLAGGQIRGLLQMLNGTLALPEKFWTVPERITIRRAGQHESCMNLSRELLSKLPAVAGFSIRTAECGAGTAVPGGATVEVMKSQWNSAASRWEITARCAHPRDCVPFLVRAVTAPPGTALAKSDSTLSASATGSPQPQRDSAHPPAGTVKAGQVVMLVWDQDGIRVQVPARCIDGGAMGAEVRARILRGNRILRAVVESAESVRVIS
jgi:Chaperone for flagella basal body P-ring formation